MTEFISLWTGTLCLQGIGRQNLEDACYIRNHLSERYAIFCISDGMGGLEDGEIASTTVGKIFTEECITAPHSDLISRAEKANDILFNAPKKMGATISALVIDKLEKKSHILSIGDTRIYHYRNQQLHVVTKDDTLNDHFRNHYSNILTKALGIKKTLCPPIIDSSEIVSNEKWLLTSDGLYSPLEHEDIKETFLLFNKQSILTELANQARLRGSEDDISGIIIQVGL